MKRYTQLFKATPRSAFIGSIVLLIGVPLILLFQNCSVETPGIHGSARQALVKFDHNVVPDSACIECHAAERPLRPDGLTHGNGQDCKACHTQGGIWKDAKRFDHAGITGDCASCHQKTLPANHRPTDARDCADCHQPPVAWLPPTTFNHDPKPAACASCHQGAFPAVHVPTNGQDCAACHVPSGWKTGATFNHTPTPTSCANCHQKDFPAMHVAVNGQDCSTCHTPGAWKGPGTFKHTSSMTSCTSCHSGIRPATATRMNRDPALTNATHYGNLDCVHCHSSPASGATSFTFNHNDGQGTFIKGCLPCHFSEGYKEHDGDFPSRFTAPDYDLSKGKLGTCTECHKTKLFEIED